MSSESPQSEFVALPQGEALGTSEVRQVTARDDTTVVLMAGAIASGKTTILVSLYELFNAGSVGGLIFGGSATLAGFERICHPGRAASGRSIPETVRTTRARGASFLHLRVVDETPVARTTSLLISDVTGEAFTEARDVAEPTIVSESIWRRADVVCVVLDGQQMSIATRRQVVRSDARTLLRAARESKRISSNCRLMLVTTKWDTVVSEDTEAFVTETEALLTKLFGCDFGAVTVHRIAARPTLGSAVYAHGVPGLLTDWLSRGPSKSIIAVPEAVAGSPLNAFAQSFWNQQSDTLGALDVI